MNHNFILEHKYEKKYIDTCLLPWDNKDIINICNNKGWITYNDNPNIGENNLITSVLPEDLPKELSEGVSKGLPKELPEGVPEDLQEGLTEEYQLCVAVKCPQNIIQFVTPFFIYIPYSSCRIWNIDNNKSFKLRLKTFCYFTRLSTYILLQDDNLEYSNQEFKSELANFLNNAIDIDPYCDLSNLDSIIAKTIDNDIISVNNLEVKFKNILQESI